MYYLFLFSGGFLIGLVVAIPIGPVNLICIRRTLSYGTLAGFLSGLGGALGDGVFASVTAFGLTAISQLIEGYSKPLQLMGGIMLLGFGLTVFQTDVSVLRDAEGQIVRDRPPVSAPDAPFDLRADDRQSRDPVRLHGAVRRVRQLGGGGHHVLRRRHNRSGRDRRFDNLVVHAHHLRRHLSRPHRHRRDANDQPRLRRAGERIGRVRARQSRAGE